MPGAHSILASLWSVDDLRTMELMKRFYTGLRHGKSKDDALRANQLFMIHSPSSSSPYYWAAFSLIGVGAERRGGLRARSDVMRLAVLPAIPRYSSRSFLRYSTSLLQGVKVVSFVAHREVQPEEAAPEGDQGVEGPGVRPLRVPPHLPDALGRAHRPVLPCRMWSEPSLTWSQRRRKHSSGLRAQSSIVVATSRSRNGSRSSVGWSPRWAARMPHSARWYASRMLSPMAVAASRYFASSSSVRTRARGGSPSGPMLTRASSLGRA